MSTSNEFESPEDDNNNKDNSSKDQLKDAIKDEQKKEVSYILEASQADDKRSKFLAKQSEYKILFDDGEVRTFKRKPLSIRQNKEIDDLRSAFLNHKFDKEKNSVLKMGKLIFTNNNDILFEAFKRTAVYCLGIPDKDYDSAIWEDDIEYMKKGVYGMRSILGACLLRAVHGVAYFQQP